jgi:hypothetical protein
MSEGTGRTSDGHLSGEQLAAAARHSTPQPPHSLVRSRPVSESVPGPEPRASLQRSKGGAIEAQPPTDIESRVSDREADSALRDYPRATVDQTAWAAETGTDLFASLNDQRREAIRAAREALDAAERDAKKLQEQLEAGSAEAAVNAKRLSEAMKELGQWRLWERLLQNSDLAGNVEAWQAAYDLAHVIDNMQEVDVGQGSITPLLATITRLRKQIDFIEKHARSGGFVEIAEIYRGTAQRIRWKVAVALAATMADIGASGGSFTIKIILAALAGAGAGSMLDEIRDRVSTRSAERTPRGRLYKAHEELISSVGTLTTLLDRRARHVSFEEGELEVLRTAHLVAEFRAINVGQCVVRFPWNKRPRFTGALKRMRNFLDDVLGMIISENYGHAEGTLRQLDVAIRDLEENVPPRKTGFS